MKNVLATLNIIYSNIINKRFKLYTHPISISIAPERQQTQIQDNHDLPNQLDPATELTTPTESQPLHSTPIFNAKTLAKTEFQPFIYREFLNIRNANVSGF